jgi:uncharacterized protein
MDWTVYWFQSIACFGFATTAMFSGISGAALMLPWFVLGFPLLGVPEITMLQAVAASLFLESAAFGVGIYRYHRRRMIDWTTAKRIAVPVLAAAVLGALVAHRAPEDWLRVAYAALVFGAAFILLRMARGEAARHDPCPEGEERDIPGDSGEPYRFCAHLRFQRSISGGGSFLTRLISTGVGEVTQPSLIARSGFPVPVAAATSIVLVAIADIAAILVHFTEFVVREGIAGIPWNLIVWGVPGMVAGSFLGSHLQGRVNELVARRFFAGLFALLGITFLYVTFAADG